MNDLISRSKLIEEILEEANTKILDLESGITLGEMKEWVENQPAVESPTWIPCSERMPENEKEVEISCIRRYIGAGDKKKVAYFTARSFYTDGTMTTEDSAYVWEDCDNWEYNEEKDAYIIPEGWWECVTFSEEFGVVDAEVIAWKPLPEPYKGEQHEID